MSYAQDELDAICPSAAQRRLQEPSTTLDEVLRAYARLPLDDDDHRALRDSFIARVKLGRRITPMPLDPQFEHATREDYLGFVQGMAPQGLTFVTAWDLEASLLIVKTDAGKGFFGRQRATYACFVNDMTGRLDAAGVVPSIPLAFGVLDGLYRVADRVG
ncbi:hypothetical protein [Methylobacterium sp. WL120]|uniref:hypothetical protein n=1 Tax=Methylobacterium sp. WL120 TaxID=2603887 RepID=UPI0011C7EE27|nr:hypothetical protein [Methylobacterium sp. WL120]TXM69099.1 hypothetical protein FV229_06205 [Methylobacterium sp. WL120]